VVIEKKGTDGDSVCLDLTELNRHTPLVNLKVENLDDLFARFNRMKYSTSLDVVKSYLQVKITERCTDLLSFSFEGRMY